MNTHTPAEIARGMAEYIREHGFSATWGFRGGCGCFAHARHAVEPMKDPGHFNSWTAEPMSTIREVIGAYSFYEGALRDVGWQGCDATLDAAAACDIAADLLS